MCFFDAIDILKPLSLFEPQFCFKFSVVKLTITQLPRVLTNHRLLMPMWPAN